MLVERAVEAHPELADELVDDEPFVRDGLVALACASRSLVVGASSPTTSLARSAARSRRLRAANAPSTTYRTLVARDRARRRPRRSGAGSGASSSASRRATCSAIADLPAVGRELAALAAVCLEARARDRRSRQCRFAVIGMGKLGGRELNYASDVDVLFVHDGDADARRARRARRCSAR